MIIQDGIGGIHFGISIVVIGKPSDSMPVSGIEESIDEPICWLARVGIIVIGIDHVKLAFERTYGHRLRRITLAGNGRSNSHEHDGAYSDNSNKYFHRTISD